MPKVLAFIPCRSGSKRIIDKNILMFESKTLIQNIFDKANNSVSVENIVISTDSEEYLEIIEKSSKFIDIGIRSKKNSQDNSSDYEVLIEVLETLNKKNLIFEDIIHLRPTYPALLSENIEDCYRYFKSNPQATSLKSVEKLDLLYEKCLIEDDHDSSRLLSLNGDQNNKSSSMPSQNCKFLYAQTAAIDIYKNHIIKSGELWGDYCLKYELGNESADIDEYYDIPQAYSALDQQLAIKKNSSSEKMEICFDIDGVLFSRTADKNYVNGIPNKGIIKLLRKIHEKGIKIVLHTARGSKTGKDWSELTKKQLEKNNIPYDELKFKKPGSDFYIDDKSISIKKLKKILDL